MADKLQVQAFRIYDRDVPDFPYMVDCYANYVILHDRREDIDFNDPKKSEKFAQVQTAIRELLAPKEIIVKRRERQRQQNQKSHQYQKMAETRHRLVVREGPAHFVVNLYDYLDTGLFLDHRRLREYVFKNVKKGQKFLNLFSYTGSVSVMAALAGATTTSVDLSNTYTDWAEENFKENKIDHNQHNFIVGDVMGYLQENPRPIYDWVFLDPPTFSNSKKMDSTFEVERDQGELVNNAMLWLKPTGILIFSNNKRTFQLSETLKNKYAVKEISKETLPFDFHDAKIRKVFIFQNR
jgi:23S rRNA (cytosine1962-C5)-methyltransferase/23S rRNA (guanine2445-N2)-methyltransferase / 23S rRNA (guanine2069-N7)-methyltransferase